jgi:hypothetical protein
VKVPALRAGLFLTIVGVCLLAGSRERPWGDAAVMYEVAEQLVSSGRFDVRTEWPPMSHRGPDGRMYSIYGLLPSLTHVPGVLLRNAIVSTSPDTRALATAVTSHLAAALLGGLTCLLFFGMCVRQGASARAGTLATLILAFATGLFVYARSPFSEIVQAACFTGFCAALLRIEDEPTPTRARALGAWAGLLLNSKLIFALSIAGGAVYLLYLLRGKRHTLLQVAFHASSTLAPLVVLALAYNWIRWGGPFVTGYEVVYVSLRERVWTGLHGLLASPGKGLVLYSPPVIAAAFAIPAFVRERPRQALAILLCAAPPVLYYSRFLSWSGDYAWGPRYLTYLLPAAMLPLALALDRLLAGARRDWSARALLVGVLALGACGLAVQVLGSAFYWDHYIRISMQAKNAWLGNPNRQGAATPDVGGHCDWCFEDMYAQAWLPPFSPIEGHLWLLRHVPAGHDATTAEADAPWRRYTTLRLDIADTYRRARVDWWGLVWIEDVPTTPVQGWALLVGFVGLTAAGVVLWLRGLRLSLHQ